MGCIARVSGQHSDGGQARLEDAPVPQGMMQGMAQKAAPHRRRARIELREQGGRGIAAYRFGELEIASCRWIHADVGALVLDRERLYVRDCGALRGAAALEQCSRRRARSGERW